MDNSRFKFRAWDKVNKVLTEVSSIHFNSMFREVSYAGLSGEHLDYDRNVRDFVLEQWTGLKDKNGNMLELSLFLTMGKIDDLQVTGNFSEDYEKIQKNSKGCFDKYL